MHTSNFIYDLVQFKTKHFYRLKTFSFSELTGGRSGNILQDTVLFMVLNLQENGDTAFSGYCRV